MNQNKARRTFIILRLFPIRVTSPLAGKGC